MIYSSWYIECDRWKLVIIGKNPKDQDFEKMEKKNASDIIILHMCTKCHNHIRISSFYTCVPKTRITLGRFLRYGVRQMSSFYTYVPKVTIIWCMVPKILGTTDRIFVILDHFVPFDPPNNQKNQNLEKIKNT